MTQTTSIRLLAGALLALLLSSATAQEWPTKPVRMIIPFAAGGATDILGRIVAAELQQSFGHAWLVDNRGGAGGNIGAAEAAKAAPDGYTFMLGTPGTQSINQFIYAKMPYDSEKDFAPVSFVATVPNVLAVNPSFGFKTAKDLIDYARNSPGKLNASHPGNGSTGHIALEYFRGLAKIDVQLIPYKGSGPAITDMLGNQVQFTIDNLPAYVPHIQSGKLVALAVTSAKPSPVLPGVPTLGATLPGFDATSWFVLMAPARTPDPIIRKTSAEVDRILKRPAVLEKLKPLGAEPVGGTPEQLGAYIAAETRKWREVVSKANIKVD